MKETLLQTNIKNAYKTTCYWLKWMLRVNDNSIPKIRSKHTYLKLMDRSSIEMLDLAAPKRFYEKHNTIVCIRDDLRGY